MGCLFRPDNHPYVAGRDPANPEDFSLVPTGQGIGKFIDDFVPFGHTFASNHDVIVDFGINKLGLPDILVNIPTMLPVYAVSLVQEVFNFPITIVNAIFGTEYNAPFEHSHSEED